MGGNSISGEFERATQAYVAPIPHFADSEPEQDNIQPQPREVTSFPVSDPDSKGPYIMRDAAGNIIERGFYDMEGRRIGLCQIYYADGQLKEEGRYTRGERWDTFTFYYPDGTLQAETEYKNGKKDGMSKSYYENGQLKQQIEYRNGEPCPRNANNQRYYPNGQTAQRGKYIRWGPETRITCHFPSGREIDPAYIDQILSMESEEVGDNTVRYYLNTDQGQVEIAQGQVDVQGRATGAWVFATEPAEWRYGWFHEGKSVGHDVSESALYDQEGVRSAILKQSGIEAELLGGRSAVEITNEITGKIEQAAKDAEKERQALMVSAGYIPVPAPSSKTQITSPTANGRANDCNCGRSVCRDMDFDELAF